MHWSLVRPLRSSNEVLLEWLTAAATRSKNDDRCTVQMTKRVWLGQEVLSCKSFKGAKDALRLMCLPLLQDLCTEMRRGQTQTLAIVSISRPRGSNQHERSVELRFRLNSSQPNASDGRKQSKTPSTRKQADDEKGGRRCPYYADSCTNLVAESVSDSHL